MTIRLQLRVFKTVEAVVFELFRHFGRWLAIAWMPWLLGTIAIIAVQQIFVRSVPFFVENLQFLVRNLSFFEENRRLFIEFLQYFVKYEQYGWPPHWVQSLAFAPFSAMVLVGILKNILLQVPANVRTLDLSRQTWLTALVVATIAMMFSAVDWLRDRCFELIATMTTYDEANLWAWVMWAASLIVHAMIMAAFYPLFAVIVEYGRIDLGAAFDISRRHFFRFVGLALLLGAAFQGLVNFYGFLPQMLNLDDPWFFSRSPLHDAILSLFKLFLVWSPVDILHDVLPAVTIGVTYKALRERLLELHPGSSAHTA